MASKETYYIRVKRRETKLDAFGEKTEVIFDGYKAISGYLFTVGSLLYGLSNKDEYGRDMGMWTASVLPLGIRTESAKTRKELIEKISNAEFCDKVIRAVKGISDDTWEEYDRLLREAMAKHQDTDYLDRVKGGVAV